MPKSPAGAAAGMKVSRLATIEIAEASVTNCFSHPQPVHFNLRGSAQIVKKIVTLSAGHFAPCGAR